MSKVRPTIGIDGLPLPILPPERDARVWARLVRVMFYTPGFLALLLIKAGEPTSFGITVELLMPSARIIGSGFRSFLQDWRVERCAGARIVGGGALVVCDADTVS